MLKTLNFKNKGEKVIHTHYDIVFTSMALHHIIDTETTIKNLYRLLKKDGYLCIIDLDEDDGSFHSREEKDFNGHNGFNQNALKNLLLEIGFKEIESNTFYNDEKIVGSIKVSYSLFLMIGRA